jgi:hypothetical protein
MKSFFRSTKDVVPPIFLCSESANPNPRRLSVTYLASLCQRLIQQTSSQCCFFFSSGNRQTKLLRSFFFVLARIFKFLLIWCWFCLNFCVEYIDLCVLLEGVRWEVYCPSIVSTITTWSARCILYCLSLLIFFAKNLVLLCIWKYEHMNTQNNIRVLICKLIYE